MMNEPPSNTLVKDFIKLFLGDDELQIEEDLNDCTFKDERDLFLRFCINELDSDTLQLQEKKGYKSSIQRIALHYNKDTSHIHKQSGWEEYEDLIHRVIRCLVLSRFNALFSEDPKKAKAFLDAIQTEYQDHLFTHGSRQAYSNFLKSTFDFTLLYEKCEKEKRNYSNLSNPRPTSHYLKWEKDHIKHLPILSSILHDQGLISNPEEFEHVFTSGNIPSQRCNWKTTGHKYLAALIKYLYDTKNWISVNERNGIWKAVANSFKPENSKGSFKQNLSKVYSEMMNHEQQKIKILGKIKDIINDVENYKS